MIDITPGLSAPQILEQNDYLPYGTKIQNPNLAAIPMNNRWRYAGKETQRFAPGGVFNQPSLSGSGSVDLGLLNFGARMYDPFTARWTAVDPMAKKYVGFSPFAYCGGNPIRIYDPNGNDWRDFVKGLAVGLATNIIPGPSSRRDISGLDNKEDYNSGLKTADVASAAVAGGMIAGGDAGIGAGSALVVGGGTAFATVVAAPEGALAAASGVVVAGSSALLKAGGTALAFSTAKNAGSGYNHGNSNGSNSESTVGSISIKIKRGKSPKSIVGAHKGRIDFEQDHIHFSDGAALNRDGTWKHNPNNHAEHFLTQSEQKFLKENGWTIPD